MRALKDEYPEYAFDFVRRLIVLSMDMKSRDREAASQLISSLLGNILSRAEISKGVWVPHAMIFLLRDHISHRFLVRLRSTGFSRLLDEINDLTIDIPNAKDLAANFIARAVYDDVLPPSYTGTARIGVCVIHRYD